MSYFDFDDDYARQKLAEMRKKRDERQQKVSSSFQSGGRDNLKYIWKRNQDLLRFADDALDEFAKKQPSVSHIEVAGKLGFGRRLKTEMVSAAPYAHMKGSPFSYRMTPDKEKKLGQVLTPATSQSPSAYIDEQGFTYLEARVNDGSAQPNFVYLQIDRQTAIDFLFKTLSLPIPDNPACTPEQTDQLLEEGEQRIRECLEL